MKMKWMGDVKKEKEKQIAMEYIKLKSDNIHEADNSINKK